MVSFGAWTAVLLCIAACGAAAQDASAPATQGEIQAGRGVLVIAVDALRADHLSCYGYDRATTPNLDQLAAEGVRFASAWTAAAALVPAHIALLTGCDPLIARVPLGEDRRLGRATGWFVPDEVPRLPVEFLAARWSSAGFVDHHSVGGLHGFDQGFLDFEEFAGGKYDAERVFGIKGVGSRFLEWLKERERDEDWFAYLHMNDLQRIWVAAAEVPELEFEPRAELDVVPPVGDSSPVFFAIPPSDFSGVPLTLGEYEARYDSALAQLDKNLGRLLRHVERLAWRQRTTIAVVGTHGVSFGESGLILDSGTVSDVDLHVPLLICPDPRLNIEPRVVEDLVSTIDLAPTLLAAAGIPRPAEMHGRSLIAAMHGRDEEPRAHAFAYSYLYAGFAVISPRFCYERTMRGVHATGALTTSWFGDDHSHRNDVHEHLHDRQHDAQRGHLGPDARGATTQVEGDVPLTQVAARLEEVGSAWYRAVRRWQYELHLIEWNEEGE